MGRSHRIIDFSRVGGGLFLYSRMSNNRKEAGRFGLWPKRVARQLSEFPKSLRYNPSLDGIRALAVVLVLLSHGKMPGFAGGFIGVDIFFVISGFLITRLLCAELSRSGTIDYVGFISRRIKRLQPAFFVVAIATVVGGAVFLLPFGEQQGVAKEIISASLFVSNFYFAQGADYFADTSAYRPFLHTWSLAVEEQFYFIWPWCLLFFYRLFKSAPGFAAMGTVAVFLFVFGMAMAKLFPTSAYYMLTTRAWELMLGAWLVPLLTTPRRFGGAVGVFGVVLVGLALALTDGTTPYPGLLTLVPTVGAMAMIYGVESSRGAFSGILAWRPIQLIGLASYAIYLWHWPILAIARSAYPNQSNLPTDMVLLLLSIILGLLTFAWFERPLREKQIARGTLFVYGAASLAVVITSAAALGAYAKFVGRESPRFAEVRRAELDRPDLRCFSNLYPCVVPGSTVAIWGDSHAYALSDAIAAAQAERGQTLSIFASPACAPILGYEFEWSAEDSAGACAAANQRAMARIVELQAAGLREVILIARWSINFGVPALTVGEREQQSRNAFIRNPGQHQSRVLAGLREVVTRLQWHGIRVTLVLPVPDLPFTPLDCAARGSNCTLDEHDVVARQAPTVAALRTLAGVDFLDPLPFFCTTRRCPFVIDGRYLYADHSHVTKTTAIALWEYLLRSKTPVASRTHSEPSQ